MRERSPTALLSYRPKVEGLGTRRNHFVLNFVSAPLSRSDPESNACGIESESVPEP